MGFTLLPTKSKNINSIARPDTSGIKQIKDMNNDLLIKLGDYNDLTVTRMATREDSHAFNGKETFGVFLDGGREGEILMPAKYVPEGTKRATPSAVSSISTRRNVSWPPPNRHSLLSDSLPGCNAHG